MLLYLYALLSIVVSFLCSIWEAVLLSITPSYINRLKPTKPELYKDLSNFKEDIDRPLSAILTLNTIAHTVGAIGVGAEAGRQFANNYFNIFGIKLSYESVVAGLMTFAILILSEIIPKTIGANNWKSLAGFTVKSLKVILFLLAPFVWISQLITRSLKNEKNKSVLSRADFASIAAQVNESGQIKKNEFEIIKNLLEFEKIVAQDIMTPRPVTFMSDENTTLREFYDEHPKLQFSRIPIYKDQKDNVTGIVLKDALLERLIEGDDQKKLKDIALAPFFVLESTTLPSLFETFTKQKMHLAVVVDEYGSVDGIVTLEDIVETLFGKEIIDETDTVSDLQIYARKKWEERAKRAGIID